MPSDLQTRSSVNMMPVFLTVYLSNNDHHFSEVPVTPETLCSDVLELCREPGEAHCRLAETWRGSERVVEEGERMLEVLQRWGQQRGEVRYLLRRLGALRPEEDQLMKTDQVKAFVERSLENEVSSPHLDVTLGGLQQQLCSKEQQLRLMNLRGRRQQQDVSERERLQQLQENAHNQEAKLQQVRALRSQVEQKRLNNGKMVEEMEQLTSLFQQKQRELMEAAARVEQLSDQLEALRSSRLEPPHLPHLPHLPQLPHRHNNLERLYKELQLRNQLNQEQSVWLQQQSDSLKQSHQEAASMERRLAELRQRLQRKRAALQHKHNLPLAAAPAAPPHAMASRVAAVGPFIKSSATPHSLGPPVPSRQQNLLKPARPDGTTTLPKKPPPRPVKPAAGFNPSKTKPSDWSSPPLHPGHASTLPRMSRLGCHGSGGETFISRKGVPASDVPPPVPSRTNHNTDKLLRETQAAGKDLVKITPPPLPSKPKPFLSSPSNSTGTLRNEERGVGGPFRSSYSSTLPLPRKQETSPAATVQPYTPDLLDSPPPFLQKPQTLAASSIYSVYTQQSTPGTTQPPGVQGSTLRSQIPVYGKPVVSSNGSQQSSGSDCSALNFGFCPADISEADSSHQCNTESVGGDQAERDSPRPLSPTKLLPFQFNPHRNPGHADLDALRRRLHYAPRPLKKRNSITEPEGAAGPNIQKLLYQKTTLAAMETVLMETADSARKYPQPTIPENIMGGVSVPSLTDDRPDFRLSPETPEDAPVLPPPDAACSHPAEDHKHMKVCPSTVTQDRFTEDFPPPPNTSPGKVGEREDCPGLQPPEVTEPTKSILRKTSSEQIDRRVRVKFNPLAILLDSSLEGEYDLVQRIIYDVEDPSMANDEGITALHNAVCAGHTDIVKFLVEFGVNVNATDSDGWTPLHCAASCNNVQVCKFLVECGAAVFAATYSDMQTAAEKCEEMEEGYAQCSQFLYGVQEKVGVMNRGVVYALWDYELQREDELGFSEGDVITVLRREDEDETEWWWACCGDSEGYVPRNLLGLYPRIRPRRRSLA